MIGPQVRWARFAARRRMRERHAGGHLPTRTYDCRECEHPWPCPPARRSLLLGFEGDRVGLMMYLGAHLARALEELPDTHPALIVGQLLYWIPRRR
ncbi:flavin reductase [Plantactinospora sp. S1510]|uniref:Flavin reductase n=1 Tax=Plantactinospora alkalitolerans TaxID=2789879 RepID=A0ABS0GYZ5_9ACTN|nr:flavin reductase [Plantactinospora alkalitolerans]MBF9131097.1 flavin reductase [Plantactinospora alkalitolerans]